MAISDSQKVDYLWKKIGYSATKSDNVKAGFEEAIPSPLQIRGDKVMTDSGSIPGTIPGANTSIVTVYTTSLPYECAVDGTTATPNRTWKTTLTDWISPEFGSTYQVKVWVNLASSAGNASTAGTSLSAGGSGNNDEWFFDYQAGTLHFIGTNLPNGVSFTGKSVYISGARYTGGFGVSAPGGGGSVGNLTISNVTISANSSAISSSANIIFSTSGTGAVQFTGNNAIGLPIGNIANRPTTVNPGYLRFNTEYETIEVWDGTEWVQTSGGVITSDVLSGDGSTTQFALSANTTTTGVLVSINGTIQKPSTAYTVSNNVITFTEIPVLGDTIEVRKLSGGTISVNYGNSDVAAFLSTYSGLYSNVQTLTYLTSGVAGNIIPSANVTYSLGSPTRQWKDLFVSNTTIYLGGIPLSIDASGNLLVNGSLVQGSGGSGSGTNYSNTNVAAYTTTQGYTNYSNVNVAAYLSTNNYLTSTTANLSNYAYAANITTANVGIIGYIDRANTIQSNQISAANVGIIGYIDLANTIQSNQISAANLGMRGYVDNQITTIIGSAPGVLDTLGELANALGADANLSVTITSQIANVNANITTANLGMKGYVDNSVSTANIGVIGYIDRANTIQSNQITEANLGIKGYIDNSTSTANIGMKGYVDSVATLSSYSNVNVSALITTNGLTNYSNVNTAAYLATASINTTGNVTANYLIGNISVFGNVVGTQTNVTLQAGTFTSVFNNQGNVTMPNVYVSGNVTVGGYFIGNGALLTGIAASSTYSNVQVATYLPTYAGNIANIRLGVAGVLTFADSTTQTTAAVNNNFGNVNVSALITTNGLTNYSNVNTKAYSESMGYQNFGNVNVAAYVTSMGVTNYSNVNVASYLSTATINTTGNITAQNVTGNISITGNIIGTLPNVTITAGTYVSTFNNQGNVILPNVYVNGGATVVGTVNSNGGTNGTAFAVRGSGAVSNVALGYFPPIGTPAEMAIRDYSTANSNMYFDNTIGSGNVGGTFQFRSTSSYTQWAKIDRFGITLPTRPAFRVNGTGLVGQTTGNVNLKGAAVTTIFNQGSYFDATTGQFTAPVAGIYSVGLVCRVNTNSLSSIGVFKNGVIASSNTICYWEADASTGTATHFGVTGTVVLAAGDYLSANITNGTVTFDGNDNWHVTYIG